MGRQISRGHHLLAQQVAHPDDLLQIPGLCAEGHLHHQCGRGGASSVPQTDQGRLRQRKQLTQVALCQYHAGNRAMDASGAELEPVDWWSNAPVRWVILGSHTLFGNDRKSIS